MRFLLPVLFFVSFQCHGQLKVGDPAPSLLGKTMGGDPVLLESFRGKVLVVTFWASWCGPCKMLDPIVEQLAEELAGKVVVGKVNVDEQPDLAARFGVMSIPTVLIFENGELKNQSVGFVPKQKLLSLLGM